MAKRRRVKWLAIILIAALLIGACFIYLSTYSPADKEMITAFSTAAAVEYTDDSGNMIYSPEEPADVGFIFYPGGKVEAKAYAPLMRLLAQKGVFCVIAPMPFNLAIFNTGAAEQIIEGNESITSWYIGGHSHGGSMAALYAASNEDKIDGLVLLASYSTQEISVPTLSIIATEDGVLNREKYEKSKTNHNSEFTEETILGGCHAYFGMYGAQSGDGTPTISPEDQLTQTADLIADFLLQR